MADPTVPPFAAPPFTPPQSGPVYNTPVAPPGEPPLRSSPQPTPVVPAVPPTPTVSAIAPTEGQASGGTAVAITGANLTGATSVKFAAAEAASFTVNDDTSIIATAPPGGGIVDVVVTTPAGSTAVGTKFSYIGTPTVVANLTKDSAVGNNGTVIEKVGTVLVTDPAGYRTKNWGYLSVVLPSGTAIDDVVEIYAVSSREHEGILVSVFPPIGESIGGHPVSTGTNGDAASSVTSNSGRIFRKVSATNWQSLGGNS